LASNRGTLSTKIPSKELTQALNQGATLRSVYSIPVMTPEILLLALVKTPETEAHQLLRNFSQERGFNWADFERDVERVVSDQRWVRQVKDELKDAEFDFVTDSGERVPLNPKMLVVLDEGLTLANQQGQAQCSSSHALAIIAGLGTRSDLALKKRGITQKSVLEAINQASLMVSSGAPTKNRPAAQVYMRRDLLLKLVSRLSMTGKRHVILVGPTGVGKRSLVLALNQLIVEGKGPAGVKGVVQISEQALLTNAVEAVQQAVRQAQGGVLFVPDIARFFGGIRADFREEASNELQKAFFNDNVAVIGTATLERYNERLSKTPIVIEHSQVLNVPPTTVDETIEILKIQRPTLEADYNLTIVDASLVEAARLAGRYYTIRPLPSAAVHLLHQACAMIRMNSKITDDSAPVKSDNQLDPDDVMVATSLLTGIPVTNLGADERDRYVNMVDHLHQRIIGQNEAILALSRAVKMARVGLKDPKRPIGSFLFLGPTGVGKTEVAKALAEFMFGTEEALITLDMSEYMDESSVNRLIGSPPGYVDSQAGGQLTEAIKKRPYSVILFDEVEKASIKVFDVLLQMMDEGRLTSGQGETVSFSECVIIMTSNLGGRHLANLELSEAMARELAEEEVKAHFRPEFLNRLDEIIFFHSLSTEDLRQILDLLLSKEEKLMAGRKLRLEMTDAAKTWLLKQNDHPEWGARPLRRLIQKHIREPMADFLLKEDPPAGTTMKLQVKGNKLEFKTSKP
jgi:ATP-dependent Clp protease ATP-binding subunit ClpC